MSFKADALVKRATNFERLALYADRKSYLTALAQGAPDMRALINAVDTARKNAVAQITQFWTANPTAMPQSVKQFYNTLRYPRASYQDADNEELKLEFEGLVTALTGMYRGLINTDNRAAQDFAQQLYTSISDLQSKIQAYNTGVASEISPSDEPSEGTPGNQQTPSAPPAAKSNVPSIDQKTLHDVQDYLNKDMIRDWPPIATDGRWGPDTKKMIEQWGKKNNLQFPVEQLLDLVKNKVMTNAAVNRIPQPGPELENARRNNT